MNYILGNTLGGEKLKIAANPGVLSGALLYLTSEIQFNASTLTYNP
jgi:hypothetical protein